MARANNWIATVLVVVVAGAGRPAHAEELSIRSVVPLNPRYLPQTFAQAPPDLSRIQPAVRHAQVAIPGPVTHVKGSHASLKAWMWAGIVVGALITVLVLTVPR